MRSVCLEWCIEKQKKKPLAILGRGEVVSEVGNRNRFHESRGMIKKFEYKVSSPNPPGTERGNWLVGRDHWNIPVEGIRCNQAIKRV